MFFRRQLTLTRCTRVRGEATILAAPPAVERVADAVLAPMDQPHRPGLFDADGVRVRAGAYYRALPEPHFPLEPERLELDPAQLAYAPEGPRYVFAGHLTGHYGHFLFSVLARLWNLPQPVPADLKLVLLNGYSARDYFEREFCRAIFGALGLTPDHFADFRTPVRFHALEVPSPAVEENHLGHRAFAELCHRIGATLLSGPPPPVRRRVFLTKRQVSSGVHTILNEDALCQALARRGFDIVSPETLPFREQVALWAQRPVTAALFGSMTHTAIFAPGRPYVALNPEEWINSNQTLLDRLNGSEGHILYPRQHYLREDGTPAFGIRLRLRDPEAAARELAHQVDRLWRSR